MPASSRRPVTSSTASAPASTRSSWPAANAATAACAGSAGSTCSGVARASAIATRRIDQRVVVRRGQVSPGGTGVHRARGLDQHRGDIPLGDRTVLDAAGHDVQLARPERDAALAGVAELDRQTALEDEEELVGVGVVVPDELSLDLDQLDLVVVE